MQKEEIKILDFNFNCRSLKNDEILLENFKKVKRSMFALIKFGMKAYSLNPMIQAFIYKIYCLSKSTYALELMTLNEMTIKKINLKILS